MSLRGFLQLFSSPRARAPLAAANTRTGGLPTSANGASSFHLFWTIEGGPFVEVAATIEVVEPPQVDALYFWALQVSFRNAGQLAGAGHIGLQHHPGHPGGGAANWGGYHSPSSGGGELTGSTSALRSATGNRNTVNYPWQPGKKYRYRIHRSPIEGWRGSIVDLERGSEVAIRDLFVDADTLSNPMVWAEVFAPCDAPSTSVRWTDLHAVDHDGGHHLPRAVRVNYQTVGDGGCSNTDIELDEDPGTGTPALIQRTTTDRRISSGALLKLHE